MDTLSWFVGLYDRGLHAAGFFYYPFDVGTESGKYQSAVAVERICVIFGWRKVNDIFAYNLSAPLRQALGVPGDGKDMSAARFEYPRDLGERCSRLCNMFEDVLCDYKIKAVVIEAQRLKILAG